MELGKEGGKEIGESWSGQAYRLHTFLPVDAVVLFFFFFQQFFFPEANFSSEDL